MISKNSVKILKQSECSETKSRKVEERLLDYLKKKNKKMEDYSASYSTSHCPQTTQHTRGVQKSRMSRNPRKSNTQNRSIHNSSNSFQNNSGMTGPKRAQNSKLSKPKKPKVSVYEETESGVVIRMIPRSKSQSNLDDMRRTIISKSSDLSISKEG